MKYRIALTFITAISSLFTLAQTPKWFKKARKAQLSLIAYDAQGNMRQGQAYFINDKGEAIAEYDIFKGAEHATLVDADGKQYEVTHILGANSLYNVVNLETSCTKSSSMPLANATVSLKQPVYIMPICNNDKKAVCVVDTVAQLQEFGEGNHTYYTLCHSIDERLAGCPAFNTEGELIGHVQMPAGDKKKPAFIIAASYASSLRVSSALDVNNNDLKAINIAKSLPDDETQASSYLYLFPRQDSKMYQKALDDFIIKFPSNPSGYIQLAELQAANKEYKAAEETFLQALSKKTGHDDEIHHSFAKLLYQAGLQDSAPAEGWTLEHALQEGEAAFACNPLPLYTAFEGHVLYAQKQYQAAYDKFMSLSSTNMRSAENFTYAAQCKQDLKAPIEEILALQDSAVNCYTKPYPADALNYLYLRAQTLAEMERYRDAVTDMNECEHLLSGKVSVQFYYEREQMEIKCRMYSAALTDIERAVKLAPESALLHAEEATVNYCVGQFEQAITAAREAVRIDDTFADAHRILGICYRESGKKAEARKELQRAADLGDTIAKAALEKLQ